MEQHIAMLRRMELPAGTSKTMKLEARRFDSITKADVEEIRRIARANKPRAKGGSVGANRVLARLRHLFNWAILEGYVEKPPFKRNGSRRSVWRRRLKQRDIADYSRARKSGCSRKQIPSCGI